MKANDRARARRAPLLEAWWAKLVAALWMLGVTAAHYFLWVHALVQNVSSKR